MSYLFGVQIKESVLAVTLRPNRLHKHRRGQSKAYHARIQKKWVKRFGQKQVPGAFKIRDPWTGAETMVVHPEVMAKLPRVVG